MQKPFNSEKESTGLSGKTFPISSDKDLVTIRDYGRTLAGQVGFGGSDQTLIATALSEICRNVLEYAGNGEVVIEPSNKNNSEGIVITVTDHGPGIEDVNKALQEGFSTGRGMGIGLPGAKRIMDDFEIQSVVGSGTTIKMSKWVDSFEF